MKARWLIGTFGAFTCVLFALILVRQLAKDVPRAYATGSRVIISSLAEDEEMSVSYVFEHRSQFARHYAIRRVKDHLVLAIFSCTVEWNDGEASLKPDQLLATLDLSSVEAKGLDALLDYFRRVREEDSSAYERYRILHRRAGQLIGEEHFVGFALPGRLDYFESNYDRTDPAYSGDYDRLASDHGLTRAELDRIVPFERLTRRATGSR